MTGGTKPAEDIQQHLQIFCEYLEQNGPQLASRLRQIPDIAHHFRQSMWLASRDQNLLIVPRKIPAVGELDPDCLWSVHPQWKQNLADIIERDRLFERMEYLR